MIDEQDDIILYEMNHIIIDLWIWNQVKLWFFTVMNAILAIAQRSLEKAWKTESPEFFQASLYN